MNHSVSWLAWIEQNASPFIVGTVASLAAMALAGWRWPSLLKSLSGSSMFGHGVEYCYSNQLHAERDIVEDLRRSNCVRILCMRGFSFVLPEGPFFFILSDPQKEVRLLLANPGRKLSDNEEMRARSRENPGLTSRIYRNQIRATQDAILAAKRSNPGIKCRLHTLPACHRLYICADYMYISFFRQGLMGSQLPIMRVRRSSPLYEGMLRHFDQTWQKSIELGVQESRGGTPAEQARAGPNQARAVASKARGGIHDKFIQE